jgi:RNA polymerase sigma-70 factor, ECF subfamily
MLLDASEQELVKGCLNGEPAFQRMLYKRYAGKMLMVCLRYAKSREEAEDVLQEGFITVFEKLHQFKMQGSLEGWVRRIMVNKSIENYRKVTRGFPLLDIEDVEDMFVSSEDIEGNMNSKELLEMIHTLPPTYKMVFNLYVFEGMTHKEIADTLNIAEGTSKSNLSDARNILKKKLNQSMIFENKIVNNDRKS